MGRARPGQPGAGRAGSGGPRRSRLLCPGPLALPGRPDANRRSDPERAARPGPVGRALARRGSGGGPVRAADRAGARSVGRVGGGARRLAVDARGPRSRSPRTTRSRTSEPSRPAGRPPTRGAFDADVALIAHVGYDIEAIGVVPGCPGGGRPTPVRGGPDAAAARRRRRSVLAGRPRRAAARPCPRCPISSSCSGREVASRRSSASRGNPADSSPATPSRGSCSGSSGSTRPVARPTGSRRPWTISPSRTARAGPSAAESRPIPAW